MLEIQINEGDKISLAKTSNGLSIDGKEIDQEVLKIDDRTYKVISDTKIYQIEVLSKEGSEIKLAIDGQEVSVSATTHLDRVLEKLGIDTAGASSVGDIKAPMPGTILSIEVEVGKAVTKGDSLLILEAMKMENVIKSPGDGTIQSIIVKTGENVEKNQILITME